MDKRQQLGASVDLRDVWYWESHCLILALFDTAVSVLYDSLIKVSTIQPKYTSLPQQHFAPSQTFSVLQC